jgi:hypothetical protein
MAGAFTDTAVLIINATGHTSILADPDLKCASKWIAPFVESGVLPLNGTVCQGNFDYFGR